MANALLAAAMLLMAAMIVYPPGHSGFYPACPIHEYLHIDCPGCGATRALAALLQGRLSDALRLNALFVVLLPFALAVGAECYRRAMRAMEFRWPQVPPQAMYTTLVAAAMFTIVRNFLR